MDTIVSCRWFPACSGCSAIGKAYGDQLAAKLERVRSLFAQARLPTFDAATIATIHPSPRPTGYRNRVKLVAARAGRLAMAGQLAGADDARNPADLSKHAEVNPVGAVAISPTNVVLGLYRQDSHDMIDIPGCPVHAEGINRVIEVVRAGIDEVGLGIYDESTHTGELRFVTVRQGMGTGDILVGLVTRTGSSDRTATLADYIVNRSAEVVGVLQNVNPRLGNVVFGKETKLLIGQAYLEDIVCEVRVRLGLTSFFQVNTEIAEQAYQTIKDRLTLRADDTVLDLFSGVGTIGIILAHHVGKVVGIEEMPQAVHLAIDTARANGVRNAEFHVGRVEDRLPRVLKQLRRARTGTSRPACWGRLLLTINPPRKGVERSCIDMILEAQPCRIAYLSCSPETLVRDLAMFVEGGLSVRSVELFDMFPQTDQVETLAILERTDEVLDSPLRRRGR